MKHLFIFLFFFTLFTNFIICNDLDLLFEFVEVDYDFENAPLGSREDYINSSLFIIENNAITGLKYYDDEYYVTVPRWADGIPSTLNKIIIRDGKPLLQPYPSWEYQEIGNLNSLQYVQSMEIDPMTGRMYIIDVGRITSNSNASGAAKLIIYDIEEDIEIKRYSFPDSIASFQFNFLNDLVIDVVHNMVYISDSQGINNNGGLIIYNFETDEVRRFDDQSLQVEPLGTTLVINDNSYIVDTPSDGIALTPDTSTLYYCALAGYTLYSIPTDILIDFSTSDSAIRNSITNHNQKIGQSDGLTFDSNNILYYGNIADNSVLFWEADDNQLHSSNQETLVKDNNNLQWVDTFGFDDDRKYLLFTSNRLQLFFNEGYTFDDDANFRIWRYSVDSHSYIYEQYNLFGIEQSSNNSHSLTITFIFSLFLSIIIVIL